MIWVVAAPPPLGRPIHKRLPDGSADNNPSDTSFLKVDGFPGDKQDGRTAN